MYPTVCTLMGLWRFVIAKGVTWRENTADIVSFLERISLDDLQRAETWQYLKTVVQIMPDDDTFPVRAKYSDEAQATIGLNYLTSHTPLWFTLGDCIAAKLLTGKPVKVLKAFTFEASEPQDGLNAITIAGNDNFGVDPTHDDFYRRLIDLRNQLKAELKTASGADAETLESEQQALKILANATSYGIFVELNVEEFDDRQQRLCYGPSGEPFTISPPKGEGPGRYFHPLIAALITGAARLMLAIAEKLATNAGIDWAFCDTDSMALARSAGMDQETFLAAARSVRDWFTPLNPYDTKGPLFKIEEANYAVKNGILTDELAPLFCLAISSKRYVLFNLDPDGKPVIRKASAHGLGHLLAPYKDEEAPDTIPPPCVGLDKIGVERWQYDHWYQIIRAELDGHPDCVDLDYHPALGAPAASRYGATTPRMLRWFDIYNRNRLYRDKVKPFNFLLAFQASATAIFPSDEFIFELPAQRCRKKKAPKPIAPYNSNVIHAAGTCFDRDTSELIPSDQLKTYRQALAQYHLSPESKFLNGEPFDRGPTRRRHIAVIDINHIGKEANHWDEQYHLGFDPDEQIEYGFVPNDTLVESPRRAVKKFGQRALARKIGISRATLSELFGAEIPNIPPKLISAINRAISALNGEAEIQDILRVELFDQVKMEIGRIGLGEFAAAVGTDPSNLSKVINGQRKATKNFCGKLGNISPDAIIDRHNALEN